MPHLRRVLVVFSLVLFAASACGGKKDKNKSKGKPAAAECKTDRDCGGLPTLCVQGKCASPTTKGVYTNPGAIAPSAIKKEAQKRADERQKRLDRSLEMDK